MAPSGSGLQMGWIKNNTRDHWSAAYAFHMMDASRESRLPVKLDGDMYRIEPGTKQSFCSEDKWASGTYNVSFSMSGINPMEGTAVCVRSAVSLSGNHPVSQ